MLTIEEDGFLDLLVPNPGGGEPLKVTLDVYLYADRFARAAREAAGDSDVYDAKLREVMASAGLPPLSYRVNCKIAQAVWDRLQDLEKKDGAIPQPAGGGASAASTGSTPST